jgi:tRNA A37 methylthiotransferase MiaB
MSVGKKRLKVLIDSSDLVCKPNAIGVSKLARYVQENGHEVTPNVSEADLIVVNTCGFDERYEKLTCDVFRSHFDKKKPGARVISIGCLNVINRSLLEREFADLELVGDPAELDKMLEASAGYDGTKDAWFDDSIFRFLQEKHQQPVFKTLSTRGAMLVNRLAARSGSPGVRALHLQQIVDEIERRNKVFVLVGRGCANQCSYCIIKKVQGDPKSRRPEYVLADIRKTWTAGKVLALVGDDCASYGGDIGETFLTLMDRICAEFGRIPIDIGYINPAALQNHPAEYVEMFRKANINNVNISLQSGSDRIVRAMNRKYDVGHVLGVIEKIKEVSPQTMIWTHSLVGFPGETWADFGLTLKALDHFHYYNMFPFSPRAGTKAAAMPGRIPPFVCELRAKLAYARLAARVGARVVAGLGGLG